MQIKRYFRRWFVLANFAILAILNNIVCYSIAPVASMANDFYTTDIDMSLLVDLFFITYCVTSFPSARFIEKYGLRAGLVIGLLLLFPDCFSDLDNNRSSLRLLLCNFSLGIWFQAIGSVLRCFTLQEVNGSGFGMVMFGQAIASFGTPVSSRFLPFVLSISFLLRPSFPFQVKPFL
jgi:MFS family permease